MSAITSEQVAHLATLAHIEMTDEELAAMAAELDVIVESVKSVSDAVSDAVSDDIPATSHPIPLKNVFRDDVVGETLTAEEALSGAPDAEDGKFKVPAILDED
ncbi:Asp-tRNA(Asn)/Glu-tRNA(Gln) amidotransferase subunit GatC [Rothia nasisuis]|uniref:Asp-tRNA(Asn)/Glu-tRNA(Gln) amidotransferase subunit GatC n=1 Tax=Rothia nasisuis TaxID=2109647 RepID=UPI001F01CBB2|nr:Asp-tRNA(Asn)/Glu-tRNA(Gln) amidotransferase subunit GatC [Rothia nasisuis]